MELGGEKENNGILGLTKTHRSQWVFGGMVFTNLVKEKQEALHSLQGFKSVLP